MVDLGFTLAQAMPAYFVCDRDQGLAANYLLNLQVSDAAPVLNSLAVSTNPISHLPTSQQKEAHTGSSGSPLLPLSTTPQSLAPLMPDLNPPVPPMVIATPASPIGPSAAPTIPQSIPATISTQFTPPPTAMETPPPSTENRRGCLRRGGSCQQE